MGRHTSFLGRMHRSWIHPGVLLDHPQLHLAEDGLLNRPRADVDIIAALTNIFANGDVGVDGEADVLTAVWTGD